MPDHVHMMLSIPPKYAVSEVVGFIKGESTIPMARVYGERKGNFVGQHFCRGSPMWTEGSAKPSAFGRVEGRPVAAEFDGGALTSDAGGLLLGAADRSGPALRARKPERLVTVALANKLARICWAIMTTGELFRQEIFARA